jgi:hypothetical protein
MEEDQRFCFVFGEEELMGYGGDLRLRLCVILRLSAVAGSLQFVWLKQATKEDEGSTLSLCT